MAAPIYATIDQLKEHIDERVLEMLTSDSGADGIIDQTYAENPRLQAAVERASSDVDSFARRSQRYSSDDLVLLSTEGETTLIGIVADLTLYHLAGRKGGDLSMAIQQRGQDAYRSLKALANGDRIFGMDPGAEGSGTTEVRVIHPTTRRELNMISDSEFFPPAPPRAF